MEEKFYICCRQTSEDSEMLEQVPLISALKYRTCRLNSGLCA